MTKLEFDRFTLYVSDALTALADLADESVQTCVTSPPYWGLRDYGVEGQLGLEVTLQEYVDQVVGIFREVKRVLRADGTLWLNLGDIYASGPLANANLKPKNLIGLPWRVAFALQDDGWYLRSDIIWHKKNPMPEPVKDRPTRGHEYIFLLSKSAKYYYDADAIREPAEWARWGTQTVPKYEGTNTKTGWMKPQTAAELKRKSSVHRSSIPGGRSLESEPSGWKNARSVWSFPTQPYAAAHFATFPEELPRRCILAGCPEGGVVLDPFIGSGTTAQVARELGCRSIGIELNADYVDLIIARYHSPTKAEKRASLAKDKEGYGG